MSSRPMDFLARRRRVGRHRKPALVVWRESVARQSKLFLGWSTVQGREVIGRFGLMVVRGDVPGKAMRVRRLAAAVLWRYVCLVRGIPWRSTLEAMGRTALPAVGSGAIALTRLVRFATARSAGFASIVLALVCRFPWHAKMDALLSRAVHLGAATRTVARPWIVRAGRGVSAAVARVRKDSPTPDHRTEYVRNASPAIPMRSPSIARDLRFRAVMLSLTTLFGTAGAGLMLAAVTMEPPRPPQPAQAAKDSAMAPHFGASQGEEAQPSLPRSEPTTIEIPSIGVFASLLSLGVDADNQLAVPPLDKAEMASWYNLGPSPGELGSAVIVGHVDSEKTGPAVFFNLGRLEAGDAIKVARKDGTVVEFNVDAVMSFPKSEFPSNFIYGGKDRATLRVITCGGEFDGENKNYLSNTVVFASYTP